MKRKCFVVVIVLFMAVTALVWKISETQKVSAREYMKFNISDRLAYAENRYNEFAELPEKEFTVMLSFNDDVSLEEYANLDIIASYHNLVTESGRQSSGCYINNSQMKSNKIIKAHKEELYDVICSNLSELENKRENLQAELDSLKTYSKESDDFCEFYETIEKLQNQIDKLKEDKKALREDKLQISGMKVKGSGAEMLNLIAEDFVYVVEILDFDNNNIITPINKEQRGEINENK
ncbi:MAG: hypothetical protein IKJ88_08310 [Clostridia bacterium]|nr:hypothetical protein [Clostridia bacterium]MBR3975847.1 hypothetical protein [Clostridia bacterium]